jgi:ABC-type transporter Mla maintaining outer membrane lipid asymmetry ATPase subunit MlaF
MSVPTTNDPSVIEMRQVSVAAMRDPNRLVAQDLNWTVRAGDFWVVAAPQYSGKTDFLMTVGGIMAPREGDYSFLGEPMPIFEEPRLAHRLRLGFVFDGGQLLNQLTVAENIALPLRYHERMPADQIETRVRELLEITELTAWADATLANLGRSWQQRAGLARALALSPEVLLLDSPLTGLDVRHATWWLGFLDELSRGHNLLAGRPATLVATADDLLPWRQHARQIACLCAKRLVVLADWAAVDAATEPGVRALLHRMQEAPRENPEKNAPGVSIARGAGN